MTAGKNNLSLKETGSGGKTEERAPFVFYTEERLVLLTGRKASTLQEFLDNLRDVSGSSIFLHTHHSYLSQHFQKPLFHNDFATWVERALQQERLAEKLVATDLLALPSIRQLREATIKAVEEHLKDKEGGNPRCPEGDEFHFCESQSFIMPAGPVARDVPDFFAKLATITNACLFFHFFEARLRLEKPYNDFSEWLNYCGEQGLAQAIERINPYWMTLEELRDEIVRLGLERGRI